MQILYSILTALCLCIGFYFGFKLGRTNELPRFKTIKERKQQYEEKEEEKKKIDKLNKILGNLDRYDGSSEGQEDIV
ncbi:MAG: hypothetical protein IKL68_02140 [Clostridia bacterium]|nr:hypothetical protein [Clostridia bacterium]